MDSRCFRGSWRQATFSFHRWNRTQPRSSVALETNVILTPGWTSHKNSTIAPLVRTFRAVEVSGTDSTLIGFENAGKLTDVDLIFTFYSPSESREEIVTQPLYQ